MRKTISQVIEEVARRNRVDVRALMSRRRPTVLVLPRQEAMFEAYVQCPHSSMPMIGKIMDGRDHTTILHGIRAHAKRLGVDYREARIQGRPKKRFGLYVNPASANEYREAARV